MSGDGLLAGKVIVLTRSAEDAPLLRDLLSHMGACVLEVPSIEILPLPLTSAQEGVLRNLAAFAWIAFASRQGVRFFAERLQDLSLRAAPATQFAAVGPATAAAVAAAFSPAEAVLTAAPHSAEGLADLLLGRARAGHDAILLPGALHGRRHVQATLRQQGYNVEVLPVYETRPCAAQQAAKQPVHLPSVVHTVVFTSPSCVQGFLAQSAVPSDAKVVSMGPATSDAVRAARLSVDAEASPHSIEGLVQAVVQMLTPAGVGTKGPS